MLGSVAFAALAKNLIVGTKGRGSGPGKSTPPDCRPPCGKQIRGTNRSDEIHGLRGWDKIHANRGDEVYGGSGMDQIYGRFGDDWIQASKGHDHLWGNEGNGYLDTSDGIDEPGNVEEIMSAEGIDKCVLDDPGAVAYNCEIMIRLYRKHQEAPKEL